MTRRGSAKTLLGELEVAVLEDLWTHGSSDVKQVFARLGDSLSIVHNTVQSTMDRLYRKGYLEREKIRHAYVYAACRTREDVLQLAVSDVFERLGGERPAPALSAFVDWTAQEGEETLRELERLVAQRLAEAEGENPT